MKFFTYAEIKNPTYEKILYSVSNSGYFESSFVREMIVGTWEAVTLCGGINMTMDMVDVGMRMMFNFNAILTTP